MASSSSTTAYTDSAHASHAVVSSNKYIHCKYHPDADLIEDPHAGDQICSVCALVVQERCIDVSSEWRTFSNESDSKDRSRVGDAENELLDGADLSTNIAYSVKDRHAYDENGRPVYSNRKTLTGAQRALLNGFKEIDIMADRLHMPQTIVERAKNLFKQVQDTKALRGRSNDAIAAACLFIACRQEGVPRSFKEMCAVCRISKKEIGRVFKLVLKVLETSTELITSGDFMIRFCSNLQIERSVQQAAIRIAKRALDLDLVAGRSPVSVAAASIFMATQGSDNKKSPKDIGEIAGVAESTIRQTYRLMLPRAHDLFPENFRFYTPIGQFLP